jgi:peroxiredoxin
MNLTKSITFVLVILFFFNNTFAQQKSIRFTIKGNVQGYANGTILYLNDATIVLKTIDSAQIIDGKFVFNGTLIGNYLNANISTTNFEDRAYFWIENGTTYFKAEKGNFNNASIYGTKLQNEQNILNTLRGSKTNIEQIDYSFIKSYPNSIISANTLTNYCSIWGKDTLKLLYKSFSKAVKVTKSGTTISNFITYNQNIKIGDKFIDFTQKDSNNTNIKVADFKGKVILLEFWGSWCGPCREQNPGLLKIYNEFKTRGFEIVGIASESIKQDWINAIKKDSLTWTNITDLKGSNNKAAIIYGVSSYPMNFLINRNGTIIAKEVYEEDLRNILLKIL